MSICKIQLVFVVYLNSKTTRTPVIELRSLGFTEVGDNLICCEVQCFGEMITVKFTVLSAKQVDSNTLHMGCQFSDEV